MEIQVRGHNMSQTASWTCFILLPPLWHFGTKAEFHSAGSGHGLGFPCAMYPEPPNAKKSCSSWVVGECHRQKLKHFVKGPSGPPIQKQTWLMEFSYWQLLFFHIQVCKNEAGNFRPWNLQQVLVPTVTSAEGEGVHLFFLRSMIHRTEPFSCYMFLAVRGFLEWFV